MFKQTLFITILICLILMSCSEQSRGEQIKEKKIPIVFILAGQSNMTGYGQYNLLKDYQKRKLPGQGQVIFYNNNFFGPELSFAKKIHKHLPSENIIIIKHTRNGRDISHWDPLRPTSQSNQLLKKVSAIFDKQTYYIAALIWMQGEKDAADAIKAKKYKENFKTIIQYFRDRFQTPNLPVIYGRISPKSKKHKYASLVRKAQASIEKEVPFTKMVNTDDLNTIDGVHFDTDSIYELGMRFADAYFLLTKKPTP